MKTALDFQSGLFVHTQFLQRREDTFMKILRKHILLLHVVVFALLLGLAVELCEEIQTVKQAVYYRLFPEPAPEETEEERIPDDQVVLHPVEQKGTAWYSDHPLIYHAGGQIQGSSYTNSREAVENTLAENPGKCVIEMDFLRTSDGVLVCAHTWEDVVVNWTGPMTAEEFLSQKIQGKYTPMTAENLLHIMKENPQMYLVTDTKEDEALSTIIGDLVALCGRDPDVLSRMIIQLYTGREKSDIQQIYPFADEQFLFTIYKWGKWCLQVAQICNEENVAVITLSAGQMSEEDAALMKELGFTVYEHTINRADEAALALERGISGIYTDNLTPADLEYTTG